MEGRVVVQVEGIEDALDVGGGTLLQHVVREDPGERHLDRELDLLAHRHLKVELSVPQLAQVPAILLMDLRHMANLRLAQVMRKTTIKTNMSMVEFVPSI